MNDYLNSFSGEDMDEVVTGDFVYSDNDAIGKPLKIGFVEDVSKGYAAVRWYYGGWDGRTTADRYEFSELRRMSREVAVYLFGDKPQTGWSGVGFYGQQFYINGKAVR